MKKTTISTFLKGLVVGGTMIVPGVSGGTMAMILGIYDKLIFAISSFRKNPLQNIKFLLKFVTGAGIGMLLFAAPLSWLLEHYKFPVIYFFMGAVFGGIPLIEKESGVGKLTGRAVIYMLIGAAIVIAISTIPQGIFSINGNFITMLLIGAVAAVALILPGISISHLFLILGMYEQILNAIKNLQFTMLLPLAAGVGVGIILFSKLLENLMKKHPQSTYLVILGFILGSVAGVFPGFPTGTKRAIQTLICISLFFLGFFTIYTVQKNTTKNAADY